jgi:hypothetical protein
LGHTLFLHLLKERFDRVGFAALDAQPSRIVAMNFEYALRARFSMKAIDVLSDDGF